MAESKALDAADDGRTLPRLVDDYLARAVPGAGTPRRALVTQAGEMWQKPDGRAIRFRATEELAVEEVAFSWRARFAVARVLWLDVTDGYASGDGRLEARLLGLLPVMRRRGAETTRGEVMRYLAELPWVPHAMRANRQLEWREIDARTVEVATRPGPARVAVKLEFDDAGDIVRAYADARPYPQGREFVPRGWSGDFGGYAELGGVRLPTTAEVRWELPEGPFTYWRGEVTSFEMR